MSTAGRQRVVVLLIALLTAALAGLASGFSGHLRPLGVALVTAAATLFTSALSYLVAERPPWQPVAALMLIATVVGVWAGLALSASPTVTGVIRFTGGCAPFQVFAQNRWNPYGTSIRSGPYITAKQIGNKDPNQSIAVNGWVHGDVAYKTNTPPWNSDIWFHLADGAGWVSFAGVRDTPVTRDPTGHADGGPPAPTTASCQGDAQ